MIKVWFWICVIFVISWKSFDDWMERRKEKKILTWNVEVTFRDVDCKLHLKSGSKAITHENNWQELSSDEKIRNYPHNFPGQNSKQNTWMERKENKIVRGGQYQLSENQVPKQSFTTKMLLSSKIWLLIWHG